MVVPVEVRQTIWRSRTASRSVVSPYVMVQSAVGVEQREAAAAIYTMTGIVPFGRCQLRDLLILDGLVSRPHVDVGTYTEIAYIIGRGAKSTLHVIYAYRRGYEVT